jgi:citrate synthase
VRLHQIHRLIAKMPTIAAFSYRHSRGLPYAYPDNDLSYTGNFLSMMFKMTEAKYRPSPPLEHALEVLFILHLDHEQNCGTNAMRAIGSSHVDPYSALAGAAAALYGPLHGGANEQVLRMLTQIGSKANIPRLHRDGQARRYAPHGLRTPRLQELRSTRDAHQAGRGAGLRGHAAQPTDRHRARARADRAPGRLLRLAQALSERRLLHGDHLSGHEPALVDVPRAVRDPRTAGWLAQWVEMLEDPEQKIARPRQIYLGSDKRDYVPIDKR